MNRIYQGKVTKVAVKNASGEWKAQPEEEWQKALWQHHELFQDAVNYYTLALAAMADGVNPDTPQGKALLDWRAQVRENWLDGRRKAIRYDGPHRRLAPWLGVDANLADENAAFDASVRAILNDNGSTPAQRAAALLQLLEEANKNDLNQLCVVRLPFLCTEKGKFGATSKAVSSRQEVERQKLARKFRNLTDSEAIAHAPELDLGLFLTQPPTKQVTGDEAMKMLLGYWAKAAKKFELLAPLKDRFETSIKAAKATLNVPAPGRKPSGLYPIAAVFKFYPTAETLAAFRAATRSLCEAKDKTVTTDALSEARVDNTPLFDYFTNRALVREPGNKDRAVWFEFDLAAFIEAIKSPHRYFQDTLKRQHAAAQLKEKIAAMESRGRAANGEEDALPGFEGDHRIELLRELVGNTLAYLGEADATIEYTVQERTVRGFGEVKRRWLAAVQKGEATEKRLLEILAEEQGEHREDFGSAPLYRALAQPKCQPIWRDKGTRDWHADDPLRAWLEYRELGRELEDKERPIRFTPAHALHSPRYFIFPKKSAAGGRWGSKHETGALAFTAGIAVRNGGKWRAQMVRITYSAPRLRRDMLREDAETDLKSRPWLQPMMQALGLPEPDTADFANCRVTLQPASPKDIQLTFPVEVSAEKLTATVGKAARWAKQFTLHPDGDDFYNASLRWPHEKKPSKPPVPWHDALDRFSVLATDLGQRCAGAFTRLDVRANDDFAGKPSRFIGETPGKTWRAALASAGLFRLPGEEQILWRRGADGFDFLPELCGERGRMARPHETEDTADLLRRFECPEQDLMPADWRTTLSFPEQNDKLLIAARRYQSRIARLHRWCWFWNDHGKRQTALDEIAEADDQRVVSAEIRALAAKNDPRLAEALCALIEQKQAALPGLLIRLANRILPLRGRSWQWEIHPDKPDCRLLTQNGPALPDVWIRGQRGLSIKRIEQIEALRRRFQSVNQTQRRVIGGPPPIKRDDSIPDCCPDLLEKLDNIKEQRVNQTAHMILAEALGLRLAPPPNDKRQQRASRDVHGQYVKVREPVDFIVIEDLSRYRANQGRAPRENSRLMKWCHRAIRDKLRELCEPFGIPVVETPAAYSSRFCSRSGVAGFRAVEVGPGFDREFPWAMIKDKQEDGKPTAEAKWVQELIQQVNKLNEGRAGKPPRSLIAPLASGPIFVPIVDRVTGTDLQPAITQADINAAINLGLRAIADPRLWSIHPRCRTRRQGDELLAREKRKCGETTLPLSITRAPGVKPDDTGNPNFFADHSASLSAWEAATVAGQQLLSGRCLWSQVNNLQWQRCAQINAERVQKWKDDLPM